MPGFLSKYEPLLATICLAIAFIAGWQIKGAFADRALTQYKLEIESQARLAYEIKEAADKVAAETREQKILELNEAYEELQDKLAEAYNDENSHAWANIVIPDNILRLLQ